MRRQVWLCILALQLFGCGSGDDESTIDPDAAMTASFASISAVILTPGCVRCHGSSGGYSFASYAGTLAAVSAGNPSASPLYQQLSSGAMPKGGAKLSAAQIQAVSDWITAGAPNN